MGEQRSGEGPVLSPYEAKENLGRTSFRRPTKNHTGFRSDETAYRAGIKLDNNNPPTSIDKQLILDNNRETVQFYREQGYSDDAIYEMLTS